MCTSDQKCAEVQLDSSAHIEMCRPFFRLCAQECAKKMGAVFCFFWSAHINFSALQLCKFQNVQMCKCAANT